MYGKILIRCDLIVCTGMHIGGSSAFSAIGAVESSAASSAAGSMAGKARSTTVP